MGGVRKEFNEKLVVNTCRGDEKRDWVRRSGSNGPDCNDPDLGT